MNISPRFGGVYKLNFRDTTQHVPDFLQMPSLPERFSSEDEDRSPIHFSLMHGKMRTFFWAIYQLFQDQGQEVPGAGNSDEMSQTSASYYVVNDGSGLDSKLITADFNVMRSQLLKDYGLNPDKYLLAEKVDTVAPRLQLSRLYGLPDSDLTTNHRIEMDLGDQVIGRHFEQAKAKGLTNAGSHSEYFLQSEPAIQRLIQSEIDERTSEFFGDLLIRSHRLGKAFAREADQEGRTQTVNVTYKMQSDNPFEFEQEPVIVWEKPCRG